ncbi:MAG: PIN domain-containing protein [Candidatus Nanohaloarchaea archaeon]
MKYALDSSAIIDYLKNETAIIEFLETLQDSNIVVPLIAKAEVKYVNREIGSFEKLETVNLDDQDLQEAMSMLTYLEEKGERINMADILIAANAIKENSVLITGDKDFEKLEDYEGFRYKTVIPNQ